MFIRIQRRLKSNKRKNMIILLFFFFFTCFISVGYSALEQNLMISGDVQYITNTNKLYDVLKRAAKVGNYAVEYTGEHQDSMNASLGTQKIYYWYGSNNTNGTAILNKNNVIFANHCWQMLRTTDTGGVKMIYNGEAENNQCLNTRGNHVGYNSAIFANTQALNDNYYYGTSYEYDSSNNVFSLAGTLEQSTWNATTAPNLVGKYTCKSTTSNGTCATLYLIYSYLDTSSGYVISLNSNSHYSQFGKTQYNINYRSIAYVGYMYNTYYSKS